MVKGFFSCFLEIPWTVTLILYPKRTFKAFGHNYTYIIFIFSFVCEICHAICRTCCQKYYKFVFIMLSKSVIYFPIRIKYFENKITDENYNWLVIKIGQINQFHHSSSDTLNSDWKTLLNFHNTNIFNWLIPKFHSIWKRRKRQWSTQNLKGRLQIIS